MTFQSTIPDIEILPEGEDQEKSFLFQISHSKTPQQKTKQQKQQQQMQVEEQPIRRKLFQNMMSPAKEEIEEEMPIEIIKEKAKSSGNAALKGYEVYKDYHVMLNLTDISYGVKGHNKFYQIQLLMKDDEFFVYTKWGRTGAQNPASDLKSVDSRIEGITMFKKKFRDKTLQEWDDRQNFQQQQGKYQIVSVLGGGNTSNINEEVDRLNQRNQILSQKIKNIKSQLDRPIYELMSQIWDIDRMNRTLKELNFDTEKNPLGRLSSDAIQKGFKILYSIQKVLREGYKETLLIDLSNQFYTNIPQNYGMRKLPMIDNYEILGQKNHLLTVLQELEVANRYINISINEQSNDNPLDSFYKLLKTDIKVLQDQIIFRQIEQSIKNTHGPTHDKFKLEIQEIYEIERKNEHIRFYPFTQLENRRLLWHGSRMTNYVGILSEGLKIAPPDAPSTGFMFGKGLYFADVCSKSAGYCHTSIDNPIGYVLLCEVALGSSYQVFKAKEFQRPPQNYHSVQGVGRNYCDPKRKDQIHNLTLESGEVIPNEELKINNIESKLAYNEYIIYDVSQVRLKYLVKLNFIFH